MIASNEKLLAVFERMASKLDVRYDRSELRALFGAAEQAGADPFGSLYRVAERYRIRLGVFESSFDNALQFVRQGFPIAITPPTEMPNAVDGEIPDADDWWVLLEVNRRGVKTWSTTGGVRTTRKSIRSLQKLLGAKGSRRLIVAQPLDAAIMGNRSDKPLDRLLNLLEPERGDIIAIAVFSVVVGFLGLATPLAVESLVNTVAFNRYVQPIVVLAIILFAFLAFAGVVSVVKAYLTEIIQRRLFVRVSLDLGHRFSHISQTALDGYSGAELANRFLDIAVVQKAVASILMDGLTLAIAVVIGMAVLAAYHPFLLGFDIVLLGLMAILVFVLGRGAVKSSMKESKVKYYMLAWLENVITCPTAFQLHGGDILATDRADQIAARYLDNRTKHFKILLRQIIFAVSVEVVASVTLLGIGGWLVVRNQLTLGQLVAAELIVSVIVGAFAKMGKHLETYYDMMAAIDKLGVILDLPEASIGGYDILQSDGPLHLRLTDLSVELRGRTVVGPFSADLKPGGSAVVVGPPGSGKSMLLQAIATLRPTTGGSVELNGVNLRQIDHAHYVRNIGFAKDTEIFEGTVLENIGLNRPEINAGDVQWALQFVGLEDEIRNLPDFLETELSSGGSPLSATQAARLMLARAIVSRPPLLLIDSLLDSLPHEIAIEIISRLHARPMPWSLVFATSRADLIDLFIEKWQLPSLDNQKESEKVGRLKTTPTSQVR
jgi:putative ABC transport system ATP-binding protein